MTNSLLAGTKWRWRQGLKQVLLLSEDEETRTRELCTCVSGETDARKMAAELSQNGIKTGIKRTRSHYDIIPPGTLIVYAELSVDKKNKAEQENIKKLKGYISSHGGKIIVSETSSLLKRIIRGLFKERK